VREKKREEKGIRDSKQEEERGSPRLEMMQFNLNSIRVSKSIKSIEPEPITNQTKSIG
jgi:hypothetical protein